MEKTCRKCGSTKSIDEFYKIRGKHTSPCKVCWRNRVKKDLAANRPQHVANVKVWREANPKHNLWLGRNQRALEKARSQGVVTMDLTWTQWNELLEKFSYTCAYCGCEESLSIRGSVVGLEMDHYVPFSRGGQHTKSNVVPCCVNCNRKKGSRLVSEWTR